jgi:hypothetical protein
MRAASVQVKLFAQATPRVDHPQHVHARIADDAPSSDTPMVNGDNRIYR